MNKLYDISLLFREENRIKYACGEPRIELSEWLYSEAIQDFIYAQKEHSKVVCSDGIYHVDAILYMKAKYCLNPELEIESIKRLI